METETSGGTDSRGSGFYVHALLGAVVTVVTSFVPFSPLVGGGVAGYLHDQGTDRGLRVGLVSGLVAALPLAVMFLLLFTVMFTGSMVTGEVAGPVFVIVLVGGVLLFAGLYIVGLSAAGGYIGASIAESGGVRSATGGDHVERQPPGEDDDLATPDEQGSRADGDR